MIKWNYELVKDYIEKEGFKLKSNTYTKIHDKLKIECCKGHVFCMSFNNFKKGQRCKECQRENKLKYSQKDVEKILDKYGYKLLSEYANINHPIKIECSSGHKNVIYFRNFKTGIRCKECNDRGELIDDLFKENNSEFSCGNKKLEYLEVKYIINSLGFEYLDEKYNGIKSEVTVKCCKGHINKIRFDRLKTVGKCPTCSELDKSYTYKDVKQYIENRGYKLLSKEYLGCNRSLELLCPEGHVFKCTFLSFKHSNVRCTICSGSKGEREIYRILNNIDVFFEAEYRFENCKDKIALPFDFYLPHYNLIIEYDGKQHFEEVEIFGGEESFELTKLHDAIKNTYCEYNNINILRIPYWEFSNIEELIKNKINKIRKTFND